MNNQPEDRLARAFEAARVAAERMPDDEQRARARAQFLLEAKTVSLNGDMRHRDQTGALSDGFESTTGEPRMNRKYSQRARLIAAVLLGVILAGGFWATPSLRALAQEIIDFFTQTETDEQPSTVFVGSGEFPPEEYVDPYSQTLDELVAQAGFDLRLPTDMPSLLRFRGGLVTHGGQRVEMIYDCSTPWSLIISQLEGDDLATPLEVGASAVIEDVPIRGSIGQYVQGMWDYHVDPEVIENQGERVEEVPVTRVWVNELPWKRLLWREGEINFTIMTGGGIMNNDTVSPCALTKDDYVAIAQGMQPASTIEQ